MKRHRYVVVGLLVGAAAVARPSAAQQTPARSHSSGLFVGLDLEGDGVSTHVVEGGFWRREAGGGGGLVLGYGFTPRWSLYSELSDASIDQDGGGKYALRHLDLGARVHFRTGPSAVVPFAQLGFSGRSMIQHFPAFPGTSTAESRSHGIGFGGGLNAHFNRAVAFSGSVSWTLGTFESYKLNGQPSGGVFWNATSARVHLGMIWFPRA